MSPHPLAKVPAEDLVEAPDMAELGAQVLLLVRLLLHLLLPREGTREQGLNDREELLRQLLRAKVLHVLLEQSLGLESVANAEDRVLHASVTDVLPFGIGLEPF